MRLGAVDADTWVVMVCEGYATGLSIRMATGRRWPVFVALDAYNLAGGEILRTLHPSRAPAGVRRRRLEDGRPRGKNPGRRKALTAARTTPALRDRLAGVRPSRGRRRTPTSTTCTSARAWRRSSGSCCAC
jgi:phage/plasmid primase-like uncharacterized protein